jgi:hypothetical protein
MKHHRFLLFFVFLILLQGQINAQIEINQQKEKPVFTPNQDSTNDYQNVVIITYPDGAFFTANKKYLGITPLEAKLSLGINHFYITKPGYQIFENKYIISKNSGRFEIQLILESSLSADSSVTGIEIPPTTPSDPDGFRQAFLMNKPFNNDSIYMIDKMKFDAAFKRLKKNQKTWYNIMLGCLAGGTLSSIYANVTYKNYKTAADNVNQMHDRIVVADKISYGLFSFSVVPLLVALGYDNKIQKLWEK